MTRKRHYIINSKNGFVFDNIAKLGMILLFLLYNL